jgi:hypothetical protein
MGKSEEDLKDEELLHKASQAAAAAAAAAEKTRLAEEKKMAFSTKRVALGRDEAKREAPVNNRSTALAKKNKSLLSFDDDPDE